MSSSLGLPVSRKDSTPTGKSTASSTTTDCVKDAARSATASASRAADSRWLDRLARVGLAARGLVYVLVALLAAKIALGRQDKSADQKGAFQTLAQNGLGKAVLWVVVLGFVGYALWQLTEAAFGHRDADGGTKRTGKRLVSAGKAVSYTGLAVAAAKTAMGRASGSRSGQTATAKVLAHSGGRTLVVLAGLVVIGVGGYLAYRGAAKKFERSLSLSSLSASARTAVVRLGQSGHVARGVVFGIIGALVIAAAVTFDPAKARGFDAALTTLAGQPYGRLLLLLVALGLLCFGAFSFAEARYRRM